LRLLLYNRVGKAADVQKIIIHKLDAHQRLLISLAIAVITFLLPLGQFKLSVQLILTWNGFALTAIVLAWLKILFAEARTIVRTAKLQDTGRTAIFIFVIAAAVASLFAVLFLLGSAKELHGKALSGHVLAAASTVVCSWCLIHTIFALHYAYAFYQKCEANPHSEGGEGLQFPGEELPDFLDFAYFSFVIGMTFQVSDVQITSIRIRALALVHGMVSFLFSAAILALAINLTSGLIGG
jgi:uncharacterized membrane protein